MVRRSQTSNPRATVVLTSGANWHDRAASQRSAAVPLPRKQAGKVRELQATIGVLRRTIKGKRWDEVRHHFRRASALTAAIPAGDIKDELEELSALRKKFAARNTPAAHRAATQKKKAAARARKAKLVTSSTAKPTPKQAAAKPARKSAPKTAAPSKPATKPAPIRELGDRLINRAALGYAPADDRQS